MKNLFRLFVLPLLLLLVTGFQSAQAQPGGQKEVHIEITKIGQIWRAILQGYPDSAVHVAANQKVIFHAVGTDVYFQFDNDKLFGGHTQYVKSGESLKLSVGQIKRGEYTYAAFCLTPKKFAEGNSPPKIIVD